MSRVWLAIGAVNGACGVTFGAVGAHVLEQTASAVRVGWVETGAQYQMIHALVLVALAWVAAHWPSRWTHAAGGAFIVGAVLFSGGLYVAGMLDTQAVIQAVPFGGVSYIAGWLLLMMAAVRGSCRQA